MEIIAIPSFREGGLNEIVHPLFGKCDSFTFITLDNNEITQVKVIENSAADETRSSGTLAAKIIRNNGAEKLIISKLGLNASMALNSLKIKTIRAPEGKMLVKDLVALYLKGKIKMTPSEDLIIEKDLE
ncbi:MAG TPA: NifB/NifX family molybdenum-iron cluster-binding protein [Candidatus Nanopelagicaceae bacterium]|nr:NifB/NifX family molybdenum-iron cluster-binding protein [Candidatus Nanopelagicaceae bacterium]